LVVDARRLQAQREKSGESQRCDERVVSPCRAAPRHYAFAASGEARIKITVSDSAGKHEGLFRSFNGTVRVANGSIRETQIVVDVDLSSLQLEDGTLDARLKSGTVANARRDRHARFVSTSIERGGEQGATDTVKGNLELLGITRAIEIPSTVHVRGSDVDLDGEFTLSRKAFGLSLPGKYDAAVADEVTVSLVIAAYRIAE
jgi:polyisoprenoid-binding protein YceI